MKIGYEKKTKLHNCRFLNSQLASYRLSVKPFLYPLNIFNWYRTKILLSFRPQIIFHTLMIRILF